MARSGANDHGERCTKCHSGRRIAVWLIYKKNGQLLPKASQETLCNPCFNEWTELHYVDEYHIARLSEDEALFEVNSNGKRHPRSSPAYATH